LLAAGQVMRLNGRLIATGNSTRLTLAGDSHHELLVGA
jgi:hypothetical protein